MHDGFRLDVPDAKLMAFGDDEVTVVRSQQEIQARVRLKGTTGLLLFSRKHGNAAIYKEAEKAGIRRQGDIPDVVGRAGIRSDDLPGFQIKQSCTEFLIERADQ